MIFDFENLLDYFLEQKKRFFYKILAYKVHERSKDFCEACQTLFGS